MDDFEKFWQIYPKKIGKLLAKKIYAKLSPPISDVIATLEWQTKSDMWTKEDGQFIPNPSTWLNQGRWMDEPQKVETKNGKPWYESASGCEQKAKELGIARQINEPPFQFYQRVKKIGG